MGWLKVDDGFADHPKVIGLSLAARGLWITGLVYAGRQLTDGFIPSALVRKEHDDHADRACAELVEIGLWDPTERGFNIHDYLEYNWSKEEILMRKHLKSEAGRRGGEASAKARAKPHAKATGPATSNDARTVRTATSNGAHTPYPYPLEIDKPISSAFDVFYSQYPRKIDRKRAESAWKHLSAEDQEKAIAGLPAWAEFYATRDKEFIPHPATWLNNRRWEAEVPKPATPVGRSPITEYVNSQAI